MNNTPAHDHLSKLGYYLLKRGMTVRLDQKGLHVSGDSASRSAIALEMEIVQTPPFFEILPEDAGGFIVQEAI